MYPILYSQCYRTQVGVILKRAEESLAAQQGGAGGAAAAGGVPGLPGR